MSKKNEKSIDVAKESIQPNIELSEAQPITMMGIHKDGSGWKFVKVSVVGDKVISKEETDHPTMKSICWEEFKINSVKEFLKEV